MMKCLRYSDSADIKLGAFFSKCSATTLSCFPDIGIAPYTSIEVESVPILIEEIKSRFPVDDQFCLVLCGHGDGYDIYSHENEKIWEKISPFVSNLHAVALIGCKSGNSLMNTVVKRNPKFVFGYADDIVLNDELLAEFVECAMLPWILYFSDLDRGKLSKAFDSRLNQVIDRAISMQYPFCEENFVNLKLGLRTHFS